MTARFVSWLIDARWPLLAAAVIAAGLAYRSAAELSFDRSIENMFAPSDPLLPPFRKLKDTFGGNEIVLAVYEDEELLAADGSGLARLAAITQRMKQVPGVRDVLSLSEVNRTLEHLERVYALLPLGTAARSPPILSQTNELARRYRDLFAGYTHSADGQVAALAVMLVPESAGVSPRRETIDALRAVIQDLPPPLTPGMLAGEPVMLTDGFRYLEADGDRLGRTSLLLLALVIFICFRSVRWVLIPIAVVQWTMLVTQALLVASGLRLSMVSSMLGAIVTVVGIATVIHLIVRFRDELDALGTSAAADSALRKRSLASAASLLLAPIVWSCLTDAVGFGSLLGARVGPVRDFGLMTALGSLLVLAAVALLVPGLALCGTVDAAPQSPWGGARLERRLARLVTWVERHPKPLLALLALLSLAAIWGSFLTRVETDFTRNFRSSSPVVQSYAFIEERLGGAGVWDVIVPAPATLSDEYLARVRAFEERLREIRWPAAMQPSERRPLTKVLSLADADAAAQAHPALALATPEIRAAGMASVMPAFSAALRNREPDAAGRYYLRIMLRAEERQGAAEKQWLIREVARLADEAFPATADSPGAEVTGFYVLLAGLIDSLLADQWTTFALAASGIFLMLIVALRGFRLAAIAVVPNALPIFFTLGGMGWLSVLGSVDLKLNMGAAMIAAVSMGLSVDSSLHYLLSYRRAKAAGQDKLSALHTAQHGVGRAMIFSTLALVVGFCALGLSEFIPTIYFGVLVSVAMLGGLAGNLLVLPLLVRVTPGV